VVGIVETGGAGSLALTFLRPNSLLTGEKYRGICIILPSKMHPSFSNPLIFLENHRVRGKSEQGSIRELTGSYQGIYLTIRDLSERN
jgi:hypothetical protein